MFCANLREILTPPGAYQRFLANFLHSSTSGQSPSSNQNWPADCATPRAHRLSPQSRIRTHRVAPHKCPLPQRQRLNAPAPPRMTLSKSTGARPFTASTTPGSASSAPIAPSTCRPPQLLTITPFVPCSSVGRASSGCRMPLGRIGSSVNPCRKARFSYASDGRE